MASLLAVALSWWFAILIKEEVRLIRQYKIDEIDRIERAKKSGFYRENNNVSHRKVENLEDKLAVAMSFLKLDITNEPLMVVDLIYTPWC